jgi:tellurite resistance protein TehA-like permease
MGVGLGLWWGAFAVYELVRLNREGGVPFHPGWWGFVFPLAAMTLAITAVGTALGSTLVELLGALGAVLLGVVWVIVGLRSIRLVQSARPR